MEQKVVISEKMRAVNRTLVEHCVGMDHCLTGKGRNIVVEVPRGDCDRVLAILKDVFGDTVLLKNALGVVDDIHDFILVKPMITEAPLVDMDGIPVPALEKRLVDQASDKEYASLADEQVQRLFQQSFELYPVNLSRLFRYAARKGKKAEIEERVDLIDTERVRIVKTLQQYFADYPVRKAWLFGSFSRMEERPDSDVDILILWEPDCSIGLLTLSGMALELENLLHRKVDLVSEGAIRPFAQERIHHDRILVYERAS
jgi:hypothetical protein